MYIYYIFLINSSVEGHLGFFKFLAVINRESISEHVWGIALWLGEESCALCPWVIQLDLGEDWFSPFFRITAMIFKQALQVGIPTCIGWVCPQLRMPSCMTVTCFLILAILTGVRWNLIVSLLWIFLMVILTLDTVELRTGNFILAKRNLKIICSVLLDVKFHKHILITFIPYSSPQLLTDLPTPIHFILLFCFIISFCLVLRKLRFLYLRKLLSRHDLMRINKHRPFDWCQVQTLRHLSIVNFMSYHHLQTADI